MRPTIKIYLDTRRSKKNTNSFPVKLKVTFQRMRKYYPLNLYMTEEEFRLMENPGLVPKNYTSKQHLKNYRVKCDAFALKATGIIDTIKDFTFPAFEKQFFRNKSSLNDVYFHYSQKISALERDAKINTASNYRCSQKSLQVFSPKLKFKDVNVQFLNEYEKWLIEGGKSISTVGIYLRPLRAILNNAIEEGELSKEDYPFGKRKYQIPASRNIKKALSIEEIERIFQYRGSDGSLFQMGRDFFILSYLCNGINMKDIALLQYTNLQGDWILFNSAKTLNTRRSGLKTIRIPLHSEVREIISRWGNKETDGYIFPILQKGISPKRESVLINQFTKLINKYIRKVSKSVNIDKPVSTYYARHSFATVLKRNGASTELIGESLGHSSIKTTLSYLDSFEDETLKEWAEVLTKF